MLPKPLNKIIYLDIETVPQKQSFYDLSLTMQELFLKKFKREAEEMIGLMMDEWDIESLNTEEWKPKLEKFYNNRAALHSEFNKIVCISIGFFKTEIPLDLSKLPTTQDLDFEMRSFYGTDERKILTDFYSSCKSVLDKSMNHTHYMCAHHGLGFDFPVIAKRMILNGMPLPPYLDIADMPNWKIEHLLDTKNSWKFGVWDNHTSLALLSEVFDVKSSKQIMSGGDVRQVYYGEKDYAKIATYCSEDIICMATVYLRMKGIKNNVVPV